MEISGINPDELERFLADLSWPAGKQTVIESAKGQGAPEEMLEDMRYSLPVKSFSGPDQVAGDMRH